VKAKIDRRSLIQSGAVALALLVPAPPGLAQDHTRESLLAAQAQGARQAICPPPGTRGMSLDEMFDPVRQQMDPVRVFDDLYMLGTRTVSAWALTTPDGIILFDAMLANSVVPSVEQSLRRLGLDPADIKYVVVSHAHNDHFGGARYLQDTYGALVVMSEKDWEHLHTWPQLGTPAPYPRKDLAVRDGSTLTLGGVTVRFVETPGHTPGTLSPIFPVRDGERTHYVGYWGASAVSFLSSEGIAEYMGSVDRFMRADSRIDVPLTNHPNIDGSLLKAQALATRRPGDSHPFVMGNDGFRHWMQAIHDCAGEVIDQKIAAGQP
jgi:metallo-beta-lactamase class B